jgi:hypothetical protein
LLKGLKKGIARAFLVIGLTSGSSHSIEMPILSSIWRGTTGVFEVVVILVCKLL